MSYNTVFHGWVELRSCKNNSWFIHDMIEQHEIYLLKNSILIDNFHNSAIQSDVLIFPVLHPPCYVYL